MSPWARQKLKGLGFLLQGAWSRSVWRRPRPALPGSVCKRCCTSAGPGCSPTRTSPTRPRSPSGTRRTSPLACPGYLGAAGLDQAARRRGIVEDAIETASDAVATAVGTASRAAVKGAVRALPAWPYTTNRLATIEADEAQADAVGRSMPSWPPPRTARPGRARCQARCSSSCTRSWPGWPNLTPRP